MRAPTLLKRSYASGLSCRRHQMKRMGVPRWPPNERRGWVTGPLRTGQVRDDRTFHIAGLRWENSIDGVFLQHRFGAEVQRLWGDYGYDLDVQLAPGYPFPSSPGSRTTRTASPSPGGYENPAYWEVRARFAEQWTVEAGVRIDVQTYDGSDDGELWSPRLSVLYALSPTTKLRAGWGRFYQSHGINELQVEDGISQFYPAQHADHVIASLDHSFDAGFDLRVEAIASTTIAFIRASRICSTRWCCFPKRSLIAFGSMRAAPEPKASRCCCNIARSVCGQVG